MRNFILFSLVLNFPFLNCYLTSYVNIRLEERKQEAIDDYTNRYNQLTEIRSIPFFNDKNLNFKDNPIDSDNIHKLNKCKFPYHLSNVPDEWLELSEFLKHYGHHQLDNIEQSIFFESNSGRSRSLKSITLPRLAKPALSAQKQNKFLVPFILNSNILHTYDLLGNYSVQKVFFDPTFLKMYFVHDPFRYIVIDFENYEESEDFMYIRIRKQNISTKLHKELVGQYHSGYANSDVYEGPVEKHFNSKFTIELEIQEQPPNLRLLSIPTEKKKYGYFLHSVIGVWEAQIRADWQCYKPKDSNFDYYFFWYFLSIPADIVLFPFEILFIKFAEKLIYVPG